VEETEPYEHRPTILWISRHSPTRAQMEEIEGIYAGNVRFVQVSRTVTSAQDVVNLKREHDADEVICNLPLNLIQQLTHWGISPIRAVFAEQEYVDGEDNVTKRGRRHDHFERIVSVDVKAHPLSQEARG